MASIFCACRSSLLALAQDVLGFFRSVTSRSTASRRRACGSMDETRTRGGTVYATLSHRRHFDRLAAVALGVPNPADGASR